MQATIRKFCSTLGITISPHHVKSHQYDGWPEKDTPMPALLNWKADFLASKYLDTAQGTWTPHNHPHFWSDDIISFGSNCTKFTSRLCPHALKHAFTNEAQQYWSKKFNISPPDCANIDWSEMEGAFNTRPPHTHATLIKLLSHWHPYGTRQHSMDATSPSTCLMCNQIDHKHHFWECLHLQKKRTKLIHNFKNQITNLNTHPQIVRFFTLALANPANIQPSSYSSCTDDIHFHHTFTIQANIGWTLIQTGFLTTSWQQCQHSYDNSRQQKANPFWAQSIIIQCHLALSMERKKPPALSNFSRTRWWNTSLTKICRSLT